ncbi:TadE/TadG family type IV pilus assembly protein [Acidipropionibacterium timonense]|uniref:TadE/TadG family type IV pilus assembly protein n=1 Tax=Acidipropionibacterium timonense TaxID=2161818 RepID=UPI0010305D2C|nr:TadE/TadG family type IV pilus assembly protein [Acidipropionibacterium timonense]
MSESVQWTLLWPLVLLSLLAVVQGAVVLQARSAVTEAARAAVRAQALVGSQPGDARAAAIQVCAGSGVQHLQVRTSQESGLVRVDVQATAPTLIAGPLSRVSAHAYAVREGT